MAQTTGSPLTRNYPRRRSIGSSRKGGRADQRITSGGAGAIPLHQSAERYAGDLARAGVSVRTIRYRGDRHDIAADVGYRPHAEAAPVETVAAMARLA